LRTINGFDEFYHGWGSEDTDAHVRLINSGHEVSFQEGSCYFLHQWHPKAYRSRNSQEPYCQGLEQTNAGYLRQTRELRKVKANVNTSWGVMPKPLDINDFDYELSITNKAYEVRAFMQQLLDLESNTSLMITIYQDPKYKSIKDGVKKILGKKTISFITLEEANDIILNTLIGTLRNSTYHFHFDAQLQQITLRIIITK
jgi:hypothetical protein